MKLLDANLLIYALDDTSPRHQRARDWLDKTLSGSETVGFAWQVLLAVVRLTTRPTGRHAAILRGLLAPLGTAGNLTNDAHLAALAVEYGAELCSCDADFSRFPGLRWVDPLRDASG